MSDTYLLYLIGLIMFGIAIGTYCKSAPIGFMVIGAGLMICSVFSAILFYLDSKKDKNEDEENYGKILIPEMGSFLRKEKK
jgi:ABC-type transport system involved in multi-copper enzyme maturation permease subunit